MSLQEAAILFNRVSSAEQLEGNSLEAQNIGNEEYARKHKLRILKSWAEDESASKELDRKKFEEAVQFLRDNNIKHFIFHKVDRCVRGFRGALLIEELFEREGVTFHFTEQNLKIHKDSPSHDKTQLYFHIMFAKIYVENLKGEIKKGVSVRESKGYWNYKAPFGYKNVREKDKQASVALDETAAPAIRKSFELYATGNYSMEELAEFIQKSTGQQVTKRLAESVLSNPFYYGKIRIKDTIRDGLHQPLIDEKLFLQCQRIRTVRAKFLVRGNGSRVVKPFMGMMKCGECGCAITGEAKVKSSGKIFVYYHCSNRKCVQRKNYANQDDLYAQLVVAFEPFSKFTPKARQAFIERVTREWDAINAYATNSILKLQDKKKVLTDKMNLARELKNSGQISEEAFSKDVTSLMTEYDDCTIEVNAHNVAENKTFKEGLKVIELLESARDFMWLSENWLDKVRLAKLVISNPTLKDGKIEYHYQKPFDTLIDLTTLRNWWI